MIECHVASTQKTMVLFQPEDLADVSLVIWQDLVARLEKSDDYFVFYTKEWTFQNLVLGHLQLWRIEKTLLLTQVANFPACRALQIIFADGEGYLENIPFAWEIFQRFAVTQKCQHIMLFGRKGWERAVRRYVDSAHVSNIVMMTPVSWPKGH